MSFSNRFVLYLLFINIVYFAGIAYSCPVENSVHKIVGKAMAVLPAIQNDLDTLNSKQIKKIAIRYLEKQQKQNRRTIRHQRKQVRHLSEELEAAIADAIAKNIFSNRALIVGADERAIGEGMSKHIEITQEPNPDDYPYYKVPRAHKNLYDADVQLQQTITQQAAVTHYLVNPALLVAAIPNQKASTASAPSEKGWIHQQIDNLIENRL